MESWPPTPSAVPQSGEGVITLVPSNLRVSAAIAVGSGSVVAVGSLNGTYLHRERVEDGELVAGDELQIGKFKLVFFAGSRPGGGG